MIPPTRQLMDGERAGGCVNVVERRGDAVHRPAGPWTPAIHGLLRHLDAVGFSGVPVVMGFDDDGREILSYIHGEVAMRPWPGCLLAETGILALGSFLRAYHEAVATYVPNADACWRAADVKWRPGQIIRHGDLGPWNTVWAEGKLVGIIDWDLAEPGDAIDDCAQLAWYAVPLRARPRCIEPGPRQWARLEALCCAYGTPVQTLLRALVRLQEREMDRMERLGSAGVEPWRSFRARGDVRETREDLAWLERTFGRAFALRS